MVHLRRGEETDGIRNETGALLLRVEWKHRATETGKEHFEGGLFFQLLSRDEQSYGERLEKIMFEGDGPLAFFKEDKRIKTDLRAADLAKVCLPHLRGFGQPGWISTDGPMQPGLRHQVAISYRGKDKETALLLCGHLEIAGISVYHYGEDARLTHREDASDRPNGSFLTDIYDYLLKARVLLVLASKSYFDDPEKDNNKYCPVELAEAGWPFPVSRLVESRFLAGRHPVSSSSESDRVCRENILAMPSGPCLADSMRR